MTRDIPAADDLARCLEAAACEVLSTHYHTACEPLDQGVMAGDGTEQRFCAFDGTARGTLSLTVEPPVAYQMASRYCSDPVDIESSMDDLQRMICGSTLHRYRPESGFHFVTEAASPASGVHTGRVSLQLFDGVIHLGISVAD